MIPLGSLSSKRIGVFGLARTGEAAVYALTRAGAEVWAWDDDAARREAAPRQIVDLMATDLSPLDGLVLAPGVPLTHPAPHPLVARAKAAGVPLISDFDLFQWARPHLPDHRVVAVTGTNGKSTTVSLIRHLVDVAGVPVALGGNIGKAVMALDPLPEGGVYVIEASSFQLALTAAFRADVAVLLNMTPDHLDRHGDMDGYRQAKARLFAMQDSGDAAFIGADDDHCARVAAELEAAGRTPARFSGHGALASGFGADGRTLTRDGAPFADLSRCQSLKGAHNMQNAAAAAAVADHLGFDGEVVRLGLATFPGLEHRQELVRTVGGVRYVNDSKATNMDAASRALGAFRRLHWIAGGRGKGEDPAGLYPHLAHVQHAYLIGETAPEWAAALQGRVPLSVHDSLEDAVAAASTNARGCEVVLLSPAAAAFDAFRDFEHRGEAFKRAVARLDPVDGGEGQP
ncbi:UDP-N-acetylmuramoyl-L-alanine--D-glutamate ligase [Yunchengibacter salinarum]|uniref:UDP-N-acetylmuramoyl-L-alanine--D-glutamate ligase n=1 Tax=Yunchengibacter salinarum TaxID=3133399 RepID=UPI0035B61862